MGPVPSGTWEHCIADISSSCLVSGDLPTTRTSTGCAWYVKLMEGKCLRWLYLSEHGSSMQSKGCFLQLLLFSLLALLACSTVAITSLHSSAAVREAISLPTGLHVIQNGSDHVCYTQRQSYGQGIRLEYFKRPCWLRRPASASAIVLNKHTSAFKATATGSFCALVSKSDVKPWEMSQDEMPEDCTA